MEQKNGRTDEAPVEFLVERVKQGDREAFMKLVACYQQKVFVLAYSLVRNREDALDLVQEVFLRLYEKIHSYRAGENFQAWLMKIARNLSLDFLRRMKSRKKESLDNLDLDRADLASAEADPSCFQSGEMIQKAVGALPEKQRLVFILHHFDDLKYGEIARRLGIAQGTVKSLHFKAIQNLRKILAPQLGGGR
ncbi:MAG: sigma-70 family RNA polymerase sigma factor [Candidatus Saccharicenans sp.]|jgi:RNA polymerase sigma-70 factor (ECF subfamily)|nr:sigma-70 family RNA polymerase sigma factor [Candidatus Saccharicenans sp.]MDH7492282.1 sigma-70 family RNA polymerase sigma factor [Candidatus Saccharicenans sp.]